DFADQSLPDLLRKLPVAAATGTQLAIPQGSRVLGFWAQNPMPLTIGQLGLRLRDDQGVYWEYRVVTESDLQTGPRGSALIASPPWQFYLADLTRPITNRFGTGVPYQVDSP